GRTARRTVRSRDRTVGTGGSPRERTLRSQGSAIRQEGCVEHDSVTEKADRGTATGTATGTVTIGIDVGGTKIAAGVVDRAGVLRDEALRETPATSPEEIIAAISDLVSELSDRQEVSAIGV